MDLNEFIKKVGLTPFIPSDGLLYKYVSVETALKILQYSSLKFSVADEFNDPFELTLDAFEFEITNNDIKALIQRRMPNATSEQKRSMYKTSKINRSKASDAVRKGLLSYKKSMGICCFSKRYDSVLMWSHYASNHKGVCIGFDISFTSKMFLMYVKYVNEIKPIKYWDLKGSIFPLWAFTKSKTWEYEEEIRAVHTEFNGILSFERECVKEIHFGLRTPIEDIATIKAIINLKDYNVNSYQMEITPTTFEIVRKEK